jgi:hypothetical protein
MHGDPQGAVEHSFESRRQSLVSSANNIADPLTEFLSEDSSPQHSGSTYIQVLKPAAGVPPPVAESIRAAGSPAPLFVFLSEETLSEQAACAQPRTRQKASVILDRAACRVIGLSLWVLVTSVRRSVVLFDRRLVPFLRFVWGTTVRTGRRCGVAARTLSSLSSARFTMLECRLRDTATRLRAGYAQRRAAIAAMIPHSVDLYPRLLARFAAFDVPFRDVIGRLREACTRTRVTIAAREFPLPDMQAYMARSHSWAYPAGLFLSGAVVGAALATVAYLQLSGTVSADAAAKTVSASASQVDAPPVPPVPVRKPAPPEDRTALSNPRGGDAVVPTTGNGATTRPLAAQRTPVRNAMRQEREPPRVQVFRGSLAVRSNPDGAAVFINGQQVGTTPLMLKELPVGSRALRVTLDGYEPWSRSVQVVAQQHTTVAAALQQSR